MGKTVHYLKDDLELHEIDTRDNLGVTCICVIDITTNDVISLDNNKAGVLCCTLLTERKFLTKQAQNTYYKTTTLQESCQKWEFKLNHHIFQNCKSTLYDAMQTVTLKSLLKWILYLRHHLPVSRYPSQNIWYARANLLLVMLNWTRLGDNGSLCELYIK